MAMQLSITESGQGPPLAILHGLFGSARNWASIAQRLAARHRVIAFDLRNHGGSRWADTMTYAEMAEDVSATLNAHRIFRYALIGHSMGGKVAMQLALTPETQVERLVVVDIAPVPYPPRHAAYVRAMQALDLAAIRRRADADEQLAVYIQDAAERGFLLQNLVFETGQKPRWRLNLAAIARGLPELGAIPQGEPDSPFNGPAIFVAGEQSDYLLPEYEPEIRRLFPAAEVHRIANAGHWLHAEQPQTFLQIVEPFLARG